MLGNMKILALLILSAAMTFAADITGKWTANVVLDAGSGSPAFTNSSRLATSSRELIRGTVGEAKLTGTVTGNKVEFSFDAGEAGAVKYSGTLDGDTKMSGTCEYGALGKGTFTATKN